MPASGVDDIKDQLQVIIDRVATSQNHDDLITAPHIQEQLREIIRNDSDSDNSGSSNDDDESDAVISDDAENIDLDDNDAGEIGPSEIGGEAEQTVTTEAIGTAVDTADDYYDYSEESEISDTSEQDPEIYMEYLATFLSYLVAPIAREKGLGNLAAGEVYIKNIPENFGDDPRIKTNTLVVSVLRNSNSYTLVRGDLTGPKAKPRDSWLMSVMKWTRMITENMAREIVEERQQEVDRVDET